MSNAKRILCSSLECSLFNQIALFSVSGFCLSLVLVFACDFGVAGQWL